MDTGAEEGKVPVTQHSQVKFLALTPDVKMFIFKSAATVT